MTYRPKKPRNVQSPYVSKTYRRSPGLSRDFRGWAVMVEGREFSLHETATEAYTNLDFVNDWIMLGSKGMSAVRMAQRARA